MSFHPPEDFAPELVALTSQVYEKYGDYLDNRPGPLLLVDTGAQRLIMVRDGLPWRSWPVSTSAAGIDNRQDSGGTPPGLHRVERKIGADCPTGAVFESRLFTGRVHDNQAGDEPERDLILTRILTLEGLEPGLNAGPGVDSRERYIYLHGTNDEARVGQAVSHGCVRLRNADILTVFDLVNEGDPVVII